MLIREGSLEFNFQDAVSCLKFDEKDSGSPHFHGLSHCMAAVDFIVEHTGHYEFVEVKDPPDSTRYVQEKDTIELVNHLVKKFRDTFLYRWAENKLDKPVHYLCLVEVDTALASRLTDNLRNMLPATKKQPRWEKPLVTRCGVFNTSRWNEMYPASQVRRV